MEYLHEINTSHGKTSTAVLREEMRWHMRELTDRDKSFTASNSMALPGGTPHQRVIHLVGQPAES